MPLTTHLIRILACVLAPLAVTAACSGQGSAEDYRRAATLGPKSAGKVANEVIQPAWIDDATVVYRVADGLGGDGHFVLIDAGRGGRRPAFDHARVAQSLSSLLQCGIEPLRLPIARIERQDGHLVMLIEPEDRVFRVDSATSDLTEIELTSSSPFVLQPRQRRVSRDRGRSTSIRFINRTDKDVEIQWINRSGARQSYGQVAAGESRSQHTFAGHAWAVVTPDGPDHGPFVATESPGLVLIDGERRTPPPAASDEPATRALTSPTSPDGRWHVLTIDHNLWLEDTRSNERHQITSDGTGDDAYERPVRWSPDGHALFCLRVKPPQRHIVRMIDTAPDDQLQPKTVSHQYLKPGDRIAHPRPILFRIDPETGAGRQLPIDDTWFPTPWSITDIAWHDDSSEVTFVYNERGHRVLRLIGIDAETGDARVIIDESPATFVDYAQKKFLHRVPGDDEVIWMSERDGWNHLYRVALDTGATTPITSGDWVVRGVDRVDDDARQIWFRAMGVYPDQDPYHVHHGRVSFDGGDPVWLTDGDGTHTLQYSADRAYYIDRYSRADMPPVHELRRASDGGLIAEMARADWTGLIDTGWMPPEVISAKGRDGVTDIWGVLFRPSTFSPDKRYPVIEQIYAGPHGHHVPKDFRSWHGARTMAELGFIVVQIDGMGTNWRSKAFHDVAWKNLQDAGLPDRIAWMKHAAKTRPWMDLDRVGIYGGSAGGQNAMAALLHHGDFYDAAVADCGCHDNRMDKIWWNELWMSWPIGDHYAEASNVTNAHKLNGDLLLIVGELDRNVDPASTMQVVDALIKADKDFELLVMPGVGHGAAGTKYARRRQMDFFVRHLLGRTPRWSMPDDS